VQTIFNFLPFGQKIIFLAPVVFSKKVPQGITQGQP